MGEEVIRQVDSITVQNDKGLECFSCGKQVEDKNTVIKMDGVERNFCNACYIEHWDNAEADERMEFGEEES